MLEGEALSQDLLETLLNMHESETLDFKRDQYPIEKESDENKSELVKDILAFANGWKNTDAYILIGVQERPGVRAEVVGVKTHIDDAKLQQLVNSKTTRPIRFSYIPVEIDGIAIGVVRIAKEQERPIHLTRDFGSLKKGKVYVRRGSSTDEAGIDEIARMGATSSNLSRERVPLLIAEIGIYSDREKLGQDIAVYPTVFIDPPPLPMPSRDEMLRALEKMRSQDFGSMVVLSPFNRQPTPEELRKARERRARIIPLTFVVSNRSQVVAHDVRMELRVERSDAYRLLREHEHPKNNRTGPFGIKEFTPIFSSAISISALSDSWLIEADFGKVQPQADVWLSDHIYLESSTPTSVLLQGRLLADNLPKPIEVTLSIQVSPKEKVYNSGDWDKEQRETGDGDEGEAC